MSKASRPIASTGSTHTPNLSSAITRGRREEFWRGVQATLPMIVGAIPFGILFGALAINAGLSLSATLGFSLLVYAGSAQFVAAGLVAAGTGIGVIVLTTFFVNLRHALYAVSIAPYVKHLPQRWLLPLGFWLTDETFAAVVGRYRESEYEDDGGPNKHWFQLGSSIAMYSNWQLCTVIGVFAGTRLEGIREWGLEIAIVLTFIGIVVPLIRRMPMLVCALVAGSCALLFRELPHQLGMIVASIAGMGAGVVSECFGSSNNSENTINTTIKPDTSGATDVADKTSSIKNSTKPIHTDSAKH